MEESCSEQAGGLSSTLFGRSSGLKAAKVKVELLGANWGFGVNSGFASGPLSCSQRPKGAGPSFGRGLRKPIK